MRLFQCEAFIVTNFCFYLIKTEKIYSNSFFLILSYTQVIYVLYLAVSGIEISFSIPSLLTRILKMSYNLVSEPTYLDSNASDSV